MKNAFVARAEAFFEEFPFLNRYAKVEELSSQPKVERVDLNLLDEIGRGRFENNIYDTDVRFILISADGGELKALRQTQTVDVGFTFNLVALFNGRLVQGETVYEGIQQLNDANQVRFVLKIKKWFRANCVDYRASNRIEITVYKVPSGVSFSDWLSRIKETAAAELKKDLAEIDRV
jgi:hypothetical protein